MEQWNAMTSDTFCSRLSASAARRQMRSFAFVRDYCQSSEGSETETGGKNQAITTSS